MEDLRIIGNPPVLKTGLPQGNESSSPSSSAKTKKVAKMNEESTVGVLASLPSISSRTSAEQAFQNNFPSLKMEILDDYLKVWTDDENYKYIPLSKLSKLGDFNFHIKEISTILGEK